MRQPLRSACLAALLAMTAHSAVATEASSPYPIAGLTPYQRPAGAPVIKEFPRTLTWRATALRGVTQPYPASLGFLDRQEAWYTPFNRPGIPGPYDLRGTHESLGTSAGTAAPR